VVPGREFLAENPANGGFSKAGNMLKNVEERFTLW